MKSKNRDTLSSHNSLFIKKTKRFLIPLFIIHYSLFILMGCSSPTENKSASLFGTISLVNDSGDTANDPLDFSGITVALYDLAYLDTTIVRINNEYPQIGVHINQHTEFDHRFQNARYTTQTDADGSFKLKNITPATYNLVAYKEGWGWRYVYEISLSKGDNTLDDLMHNEQCIMNNATQNDNLMRNEQCIANNAIQNDILKRSDASSHYPLSILHSSLDRSASSSHYSLSIIHYPLHRSALSLFPELHISGTQTGNIIVKPFHHLVVDDDVIFLPDSYFELQPNSVCRIAGSKKVEIYGGVKMQGEENGMFTVTSNEHFFENTAIDSLTTGEMINSIKLQSSDEEVDVEWGKFSWLNNGIINNNLNIKNSDFTHGNNSLVYNFTLNKNNINNTIIRNYSYKACISYSDIDFQDNIFFNNKYSLVLIEIESTIENNFFYDRDISLWINKGEVNIHNNNFENTQYPISLCGASSLIEKNNFYNHYVVIDANRESTGGEITYCNPIIKNNNFMSSILNINIYGYNYFNHIGVRYLGIENNLYLQHNYWDSEDIEEKIYDVLDWKELTYKVYYSPAINLVLDIGIN